MTLNDRTGGYSIPAYQIGLDHWKAETGGNATFTNIPFNEKAIKIAGMIATQDSSWDLQYTYDIFMQRFGSRMLIPLEGNYLSDTSDFLAVALKGFTTQSDQVLRGLPIHYSSWLWTWNPKLFTDIGEDGANPPDTYEALFALVPKFKEKKIVPCVQAWQGTGGTFARFYFTHIYNSLGVPMFSDDRTQVKFDGPEGLLAFQTIENGFKSGFWDPAYINLANEHDSYVRFAEGDVATCVHSETELDPPEPGQIKAGTLAVRQLPGDQSRGHGIFSGLGRHWRGQVVPSARCLLELLRTGCSSRTWPRRSASTSPSSTRRRGPPSLKIPRFVQRSTSFLPTRRKPRANPTSGPRHTTGRRSSTT